MNTVDRENLGILIKNKFILYGRGIAASLALLLLASCSSLTTPPYTEKQASSVRVVTADQVSYQPLNPARGDASPKAGVLWGDIRKDVPSGVLLQFAEGFSSPPHIHNITYRAVVISGEIHNDDPDAANLWMGPGTFWTQPAGEVHITSARPGAGATAFLEILEGPYLVQPGRFAFDNGERPLNLLSSNVVWMTADELEWIKLEKPLQESPQAAFLWGSLNAGALSGSFIKLPAGFKGSLLVQGGDLKAVGVAGSLVHSVNGVAKATRINAGGYFGSDAGVRHDMECTEESECLIYVRTEGQFLVR